MQKSIAIIGAGQLGSRHLQGILKSGKDFNVSVIDPMEDSLTVAKKRAEEIEHSHQIWYSNSIHELPKKLDAAIIATNANVRLKVLLELLNHAQVDFIVLEKVLFQGIRDYEIAQQALFKNNVKCFVNHPRRMQGMYKELKELLQTYGQEKFTIQAYGANWGLGCNGLHLSDLFSFLLQDTIREYDSSSLDKEMIDSKRQGFKEFTGKMLGFTRNGHEFSICSINTKDGIPTPISISLFSPSIRISITEGNPSQVSIASLGSVQDASILNNLTLFFQSELSKILIEDILELKVCNLTTYEEASLNHILFIESFNTHLERITGKINKICPIT